MNNPPRYRPPGHSSLLGLHPAGQRHRMLALAQVASPAVLRPVDVASTPPHPQI